MEKHWYKIHITECPVCGNGDTSRERVLGEKPSEWEKTHIYTEHYDWCLE